MLADEARLRGKGRRKLVALRLGADHRLELLAAGTVQLPIDDEDGLRILERPLALLERLRGRRLADLEGAAVFRQTEVVFRREEVLLVIKTGDEARGAAGRQAQHFELGRIDGDLPQLVGVGGVAGQRRIDAVVAVDDGHVGSELHHF